MSMSNAKDIQPFLTLSPIQYNNVCAKWNRKFYFGDCHYQALENLKNATPPYI